MKIVGKVGGIQISLRAISISVKCLECCRNKCTCCGFQAMGFLTLAVKLIKAKFPPCYNFVRMSICIIHSVDLIAGLLWISCMPARCWGRWFPSFISSAQATVGLSFQFQKKCCGFELWSKRTLWHHRCPQPPHSFGNKQLSNWLGNKWIVSMWCASLPCKLNPTQSTRFTGS